MPLFGDCTVPSEFCRGPARQPTVATTVPLAGVAAGAEGRIAADREHRAAVGLRPRDRADDLTRQGVADRAPVVAEIVGEPDAARSLRCEEPLVDRVVPEAVEPSFVVDEAEPVDR